MHIICPDTQKEMKIDDLASSIKLANDFRKFGDENNVFHLKRRKYWQNIYEQLLKFEDGKRE